MIVLWAVGVTFALEDMGIFFNRLVIAISSHPTFGASLTFGNRESDTDTHSNVASVKPIANLISRTMLKKKWSNMPVKFFSQKKGLFPMWVRPQTLLWVTTKLTYSM